MEKIKVAVIGCGRIANAAHIPSYLAIKDRVEIKYFCDTLLPKAKLCVEKYGCGKAIKDYKKVLADPEIKAVSICTPNKMHKIIAIAALKAGKDVLCEKPAARILKEALEMQKAQHETGKILNIGVVNRFSNSINKVRDMINAGELGEVYHVYASFRVCRSIPGLGGAFTTKAISGGGVLIDWGVHYLDIVMYCCGDPKPVSVSAETYSKLGVDMKNYAYEYMWAEDTKDVENGTFDVDDFVTALVRTEGPTISVNGVWAQNILKDTRDTYIDFIGTKGGIRLYYDDKSLVFTHVVDGKVVDEKLNIEHNNMFESEISAFIDSVETGKKQPSHIDNAVITARIMQAMYDSSAKHKEIILK